MHFKLLFRVAKALQGQGLAVLRFQFRGVGRSEGRYDEGRGEKDDARASLDLVSRELPDMPVLLGGFSFGAAVALGVGSADARVSSLVLLGLPVAIFHGLTKQNLRGLPTLFVQGERDEFGNGDAIRAFVASFGGPTDLVVVPGADHLFTDQAATVERAVEDWALQRSWKRPLL